MVNKDKAAWTLELAQPGELPQSKVQFHIICNIMGLAGVALQCSDRIGAWGEDCLGYSESTTGHDCCLAGQQRGITGVGGAMGEGR